MATPSLQVWLGQETAIDGTVTWVDITQYVRVEYGVERACGRTMLGVSAQPGTASLTLENTDGRFTIGNTGSPYYPYVHLQSLIRIERDSRPFFIGRIQSAPLSWPKGGDSDCLMTVSLADKLARYGRISLDSFPVEEIRALGPVAYYPMVEASGSSAAGNKMPTAFGPLNLTIPGDGTVTFSGSTGPVGDGRSVPTFTPGTVAALLASVPVACSNSSTSAMSISVVFASTVGGLVARVSTDTPSGPAAWDIVAATNVGVPGVWFNVFYGTANPFGAFFPAPVLDGLSHVVTVIVGAASATRPDVNIDGVSIAPTAGLNTITSVLISSAAIQVGSGVTLSSIFPVTNFTGAISHVALWTRALTTAEIALVNNALQGYALTTNAAFLKVLGWRGQAGTAVIDIGTDLSVGNGCANPGAEVDTSGWTAESGAVLTRDTVSPISGTASFKLTNGGDVYYAMAVLAGQTWTFSLDYTTTGTVTGSPQLYVALPGSTTVLAPLPLTQSSPGRFSATATAVNSGTGIFAVFGPSTLANVIHFDNVRIEKSAEVIPSTALGNGTLFASLNAINDSEDGTLWVDPSDHLTWKNRRRTLSPLITLANNDINAPTYNTDLQDLKTLVTATQDGTTTVVASDDIATIGEISGSVTSISTAPGDGLAHAQWVANTIPRGPYIGSLAVDLATLEATPFAAAITAKILAGITLTGMPSQTPPGATVLEVVGERERFDRTSWDLTWSTTTAGVGSARDVFILDDATYGVLDSTHRLAY